MNKHTPEPWGFCEFIGDEKKDHDEVPSRDRVCPFAGITHCQKTGRAMVSNDEGWRVSTCSTPFYCPEPPFGKVKKK